MPTVFISYSHESEEHRTKALTLSNRLRNEGVDASIDAYVQHPEEGWPKWMERQFRSTFLVVILSPRYVRDFNQESVSSSGARYEGGMLSSLLLDNGLSFRRMAIVCFDAWPNLEIPPILSGCTRYCIDRPGEYEKLYAFLTGQSLVEKPSLGNVVTLRPGTQSPPHYSERSFAVLCKMIWPLVEENRRIFEDFGPNSGSTFPGPGGKTVRYDLTLWRSQRLTIGKNNQLIAGYLRAYSDVVPHSHEALFRKWLSHIDAFALHVTDNTIDYRGHQFPQEVIDVLRGKL
ncbi:SEFIR domain-containing protein [Siccirubricoccus sp. G192]|uniref:SEFIR domain-containing protein n=1 Tax=Siccirubricoccus sp. G192 TaxID=2849651 RepID=UPI001C2C0182|nr:SEFIR domain-containing protein [Siccirubricoccus sp. G192]MBV1795823.1 TIR domain-containing protein [Siccirubricoccus sp. G192]